MKPNMIGAYGPWAARLTNDPGNLDFPEVLGLRAPLPTLVQSSKADPLFTLSEVRRAAQILKEVYTRTVAPKAFKFSLYEGGHQLTPPMQAAAFAWFDRWL